MITIDDFKKVELKAARVLGAERVEGSDKLLKLTLDAGDVTEAGEHRERQVLAGIGKAYEPEALIGREIIIAANLEPRSLMGFESEGMLLAASDEQGPAFLTPEREVPPGTGIR